MFFGNLWGRPMFSSGRLPADMMMMIMFFRVALRSVAPRQTALTALVARGSATEPRVRDEVNFPRPVRGEPGKVRHGFVPEEWFQFSHQKTGVSGPYTFGVGLATYLFSKEIYVIEHEYFTGLSLCVMVYVATTKLGPSIAKWLDKEVDSVDVNWNEGRKQTIQSLETAIKDEKTSHWRAEGQELLIEARKKTVLLQLEAAYRERLMTAYKEVKQRLDYQVQKSTVERRVAQKNIVHNVTKAITLDKDKLTLEDCIADLAALATRK